MATIMPAVHAVGWHLPPGLSGLVRPLGRQGVGHAAPCHARFQASPACCIA